MLSSISCTAAILLFLLVPDVSLAQDSSSSNATSPPDVQIEFQATYLKHGFSVGSNSSNTTSGFIYVSPSQQKIREDVAQNGLVESTISDFQNSTANGTLVSASVASFQGNTLQANCSTFYFTPTFSNFSTDMLSQNNANLTSISIDDFYGQVDAWTFLNTGGFQFTLFLNSSQALVRLDSASSDRQTFTTTRFFNIINGTIDPSVFETSC